MLVKSDKENSLKHFKDLLKGKCFRVLDKNTIYMKIDDNNNGNAVNIETGSVWHFESESPVCIVLGQFVEE